ncbi:MAG TPA: penicillin-binding protein 1A [Geminicoccaceae bacterium]|nr:penicillin-binding protein 1A [Geminicoccaceae bacterium]
MRKLRKLLIVALVGLLLLAAAGVGGTFYIVERYGTDLPDYRQLADYRPPTVTRVYAGDGRLMQEYAQEKRVFVPVEAMPKRLIQAFLAAEDKNFYSHPGIDLLGIVRAALDNVGRLATDQRLVGASTITQQVAKNFLLSNEVTFERKIKEALLALRIEQAFTKDQILELYLNEIYLGLGSYGVAAAALNYFDKSLDELSTAETAFLAGLPKAPSWYHPIRQPDAAKGRRDWVIGRMQDLGMISAEEARAAQAEPLVMRHRAPTEVAVAEYFSEEVRRRLVEQYGDDFLYQGGLSIQTTLSPHLQTLADQALIDGLLAYDRRHGWRGPVARLELAEGWQSRLVEVDQTEGLERWQLAAVLEVAADGATLGFPDGSTGLLPLAELSWARAEHEDGSLGPQITQADQVVAPGDVVWVEPLPAEAADQGEASAVAADAPRRFALRQPPEVDGAVVAMNPHTGRVLAISGGYSFKRSVFNRATQALRQPGSALKPFVYLAGLASGLTPSSIFLDAPIVIDQGPALGKWKPVNYSNQFYGPSTLRLGLEKSRNVMTVRLAQTIGMDRVVDMCRRFNLARGLGHNLASALGANEVYLLELTTAYAMLVNGGKRIEPALIERIQDRHGRTVMRRDERQCPECQHVAWHDQATPILADQREQVVDPALAYQMVNLLHGVVERGTGVRARSIGKPVAGKTGTSDDSRDAWFVGFTPDLVVGVYVGYDQPKSLGRDEQGASAALPVFVELMSKALADQPATPFRVPPGVRLVRVDAETGLLPGPSTDTVILEAFLPGTEPTTASPPAGATASIAEEIYLRRPAGRNGSGSELPLPQSSPDGGDLLPAMPAPPPQPAPPPRSPNAGGLY